jgi:transposase
MCGERQQSATMGACQSHRVTRKEKSMSIVLLGIDLAKNVFALHGVNEAGHVEMKRPSVARAKLLETVATLPPCR